MEGETPIGARMCTKCYNRHPLMVVPDAGGEVHDPSKGTVYRFCTERFQQKSTLNFDLDRTFDHIEPINSKSSGDNSSSTIFVFVHGGGASRAMFRAHATDLKDRYGHASILMDLPGHGTLVDKPLTLESCATTMASVLKECGISASSKQKIIYVGGSLGAYIGFYLLEQFKDIFDGAVLMDCGQNVGPGSQLHVKMGLSMLSWMSESMSNASLMNMMLDVTKKSKTSSYPYHLVDTVFGAGMFFDQGAAQVECLRTVAPAEIIPKIPFPILYMNGAKDHRNSEDLWLELSQKKYPSSELKVYEDGDHFFMHDARYVDDVLESMNAYATKLGA